MTVSVFVVVAFVFGVAVAAVDIVRVVSVLDGFVGAVRSAVLVLGRGVFRRVVVFVVVAFVFGVAVAAVDIVHMVPVPDGDVVTVRSAVAVLGQGMFCLDFLGHDVSFAAAGAPFPALLAVSDGVLNDTAT